MARLIRTRQATEDVLAIWEYIARDNPTAADKLVRRIDELLGQLAEQPALGVPQDQYRPGLRAMPMGRYVIFYESIDDGIRVIRVLHGARRLEDLL